MKSRFAQVRPSSPGANRSGFAQFAPTPKGGERRTGHLTRTHFAHEIGAN